MFQEVDLNGLQKIKKNPQNYLKDLCDSHASYLSNDILFNYVIPIFGNKTRDL
jgi:hypothetical protein